MTKDFPYEVSVDNLESLSGIFKVNWPKHVVMFSTIQTFVKRFKLFPELKEKVKIFVLSKNWKTDGSFFITVRKTVKNILFKNSR